MRVSVALSGGRDYTIQIGVGALSALGQTCAEVARSRRAVVLTQPAIKRLWGAAAQASLAHAGFETDVVAFPSGERHKSLATIARLYGELYNLPGIDRRTLLVALGGGVVGDVAGYVAATYLRGLDYVQVPTTLLAMVDSSVGGKTGVDFRSGKNLIGAFHQPRAVVIDPTVLESLSGRDLRAGMAEVVKYGVICDPPLFSFLAEAADGLKRRDPAAVARVVADSCRIKAEVVIADEREETGQRAILNFGHTIGHALEAATGYRRYRHGEAVSIGMLSAACIGEAAGVTPAGLEGAIARTLTALDLPTALPAGVRDEELIGLTLRDKKALNGRARYVLARAIGAVSLEEVEATAVRAGLSAQRARFGDRESGA